MITKGLLKAHIKLEIVAKAPPPHYLVFPTNDGKYAVAYHVAGSLWNVVGDAVNADLATELCEKLNDEYLQEHDRT